MNLGLHNLLIWRHMNLAVGKKVLLGFDISNMLKNGPTIVSVYKIGNLMGSTF